MKPDGRAERSGKMDEIHHTPGTGIGLPRTRLQEQGPTERTRRLEAGALTAEEVARYNPEQLRALTGYCNAVLGDIDRLRGGQSAPQGRLVSPEELQRLLEAARQPGAAEPRSDEALRDELIDEEIRRQVEEEYRSRLQEAERRGVIDGSTHFVRLEMEKEIARRKKDPAERNKAWERAIDRRIEEEVRREVEARNLKKHGHKDGGPLDGAVVIETRRRQQDPETRARVARELIEERRLREQMKRIPRLPWLEDPSRP